MDTNAEDRFAGAGLYLAHDFTCPNAELNEPINFAVSCPERGTVRIQIQGEPVVQSLCVVGADDLAGAVQSFDLEAVGQKQPAAAVPGR